MVQIVFVVLGLLTLYFLYFYITDLVKHKEDIAASNASWITSGIIGFVVDFFDAMGIGSFAPCTLLLELTKQLDNYRQLPGTLNAGHTIPVVIEAFIFIAVVDVEPVTLFSLIAAAIAGSFIGSKFVSKLSEKKVQYFVGWALLVTAVLMGLQQAGVLDMLGSGNEATGLSGIPLVIGIVGNFILGSLMTIGVGLYAPCMALVYMLGLNPLIAFPIMMGSCAGLMPVAGVNFIKEGKYNRKVSLAFTIFGALGVYIATQFVTSLPLEILTWLIIVVIIYTGIMYIRKSKAVLA